MNTFDAVMIVEGVESVEFDVYVDAVQVLIDTGLAWSLQGFFGRVANDFIELGYCVA